MKKTTVSPEAESDLLLSLFSYGGVPEVEAKSLAIKAIAAEPSRKLRKTDETKSYIIQIAAAVLDEGGTGLSVQRCKRDLVEKYGSIARPEFLLGVGPSGMRVIEIAKTKADGRIYKMPDREMLPEWYKGKWKFLPPEYCGDKYFEFIAGAHASGQFAFLKE